MRRSGEIDWECTAELPDFDIELSVRHVCPWCSWYIHQLPFCTAPHKRHSGPRKLRATWSLESAHDFLSDFGDDISIDLVLAGLEEIEKEGQREVARSLLSARVVAEVMAEVFGEEWSNK